MTHGFCLYGLHGIHLNLKRLAVFIDILFSDPCAFYARSYYAPLWCDLCNTSAYNASSCPYYACYVHSNSPLPLTQCTGIEVGASTMTYVGLKIH